MKKLLPTLFLLVIGCSGESNKKETISNQASALTIDRILSKPSIAGTSPSSPKWSSDSQQLAFSGMIQGHHVVRYGLLIAMVQVCAK